MPDNGVVDKVAARLTLDITPAQQQLAQLTQDVQKFNQSLVSGGQDANAKLLSSEKQQQENIRQLQLNNSAMRLAMFTKLQGDMEIAQAESNAKIERQNEAHLQKMYQTDQMYQERMNQLQARGTQSSGYSSSSILGGGLVSHAVDIAAGLTLFQLVGTLEKLPELALEAQASMTKLQQVLELGPSQEDLKRYGSLNGMLQQLQQTAGVMAQTYGVDLNTVIDAMSLIGRKYKDVGDIVVLTDTALQMFAVDNVPVEQSVSALEAMMSQFHLSTSDARQALFDLTAAAHEFQTTGTDLMNAIERSGASFATLKMNTSESIAAIAALGQMTAQSGSVIGNAWKSIEASMISDKGVQALKNLGIAAYDANGNLKDGVQILQQLEQEWPKLSDAAKIHFAEVLAGGKYQYERLLTFLNDYTGQYQKALDSIKQANAKQQEELVATALASPTKQLQMTKASFEVLANTIMQKVTPSLITLLTMTREDTQAIAGNWSSIEHWLSTGATLAEAFIAWKVGLAAYNWVLGTTIVTQARFSAGVAAIIGQRMGFVAGLQSMGGAVMGFGAQVAGVLGKMGAFLALFSVIQNTASRIADPLDAKIGDIQSRIQTLDDVIKDAKSGNFGAGTAIRGWGQVLGDLNPFSSHGMDFTRAMKDLDQLTKGGVNVGNLPKLESQRADLVKQLYDAQNAKNQQQQDEIKKSLDEMNKIIADELKKAENTGKGPGGSGPPPSGTQNPPTGKPKSTKPKGPSVAQKFMQPFIDSTNNDNSMLQGFKNTIDGINFSTQMFADKMQLADAQLQDNMNNTKAATAYTAAYLGQKNSLNDAIKEYSSENAQLQSRMKSVQDQIQAVNAEHAKGKITDQEHSSAISKLNSDLKTLTSTYNSNRDAILKDQTSIQQLTETWKQHNAQLMNNQFADQIKDDTNAINSYGRALTTVNHEISTFSRELSNAEKDLGKGSSPSTVLADYNKEVQAINTSTADLTKQNQDIHKTIVDLNQELDKAKSQYQSGKITVDDYNNSVESIRSQIDSLTQTLYQNQDAIAQNSDTMQQAAQGAADAINKWNFDNANTAIKGLIDQMKNLEQNELNNLDAQIKGIDQQLSDLQYNNTTTDNQTKLAKLQAEAAKWQNATSVQGKQKYQDYLDQIAQLQKQMNYDAERHQLETQKQGLQDQKQAVQDHYNTLLGIFNNFSANIDSVNSTLSQLIQQRAVETDGVIQGLLDQEIAKVAQLANGWKEVQQNGSNPPAVVNNPNPIDTSGSAPVAPIYGAGGNKSNPNAPPIPDPWANYQGDYSSNPSIPAATGGGGGGANGTAKYGPVVMPFAKGGQVPMNIGTPGVDSVPAMLRPGEIVAPSWDDLTSFARGSGGMGGTVINIEMAGAMNGAVIHKDVDLDKFMDKFAITAERIVSRRLRFAGVRG